MEQLKCKCEDCQADWSSENPSCLYGERNHKKCENFIAVEEDREDKIIENGITKEDFSIPWHGNTMGVLDLAFTTSQKRPIIIGVIGPAKSGKTTLLATLYMLLRKGKMIGDFQFAGSYTLLGWEKIAQSFTLNKNKKLTFPPHTSSNMARIPGLLHLTLKDKLGIYQDLIFTDAPGEWFKEWALSPDSDESKGARWIDDAADAFILIADCALFKKEIGKARMNLMDIVSRMKNTYRQRPIAMAWTKSDNELDGDIKLAITDKVRTKLSNVKPYDVAVINHTEEILLDNILNLVNYLLIEKHQKRNNIPKISIKKEDDFFFIIR